MRKMNPRPKSGAGGNRTRVQTYPPKAFYMLISALGCRNVAGAELTNPVRIRLDFHYTLTETMCTYPSMVWFGGGSRSGQQLRRL